MSLGHIQTWVFDLDNTLYPAPALYDAIGARMTAYIARTLSLSDADALTLREHTFHTHGATVVGLMKEHGVDAHDFIADVHAVDYGVLTPDPELGDLIAALPGRKIIFTNGSSEHAANVLDALACGAAFETIFAIETADFAPKPQRAAYERLAASCAVTPAERAVRGHHAQSGAGARTGLRHRSGRRRASRSAPGLRRSLDPGPEGVSARLARSLAAERIARVAQAGAAIAIDNGAGDVGGGVG
ncbi:MAG: hypothetical protein R3C16_11240 [Hyphomonadaceae bacterium]